MRTALLLATLLCSSAALADVYTSQDDFHFSLSRCAMTGGNDGDLHVSAAGVFAANGARRMSRNGDFQTHEVVVLDEPYELRDASGQTWRMSLHFASNRMIEVDLVRVEMAAQR